MMWAIVKKAEHSANVEKVYEAPESRQKEMGGKWGNHKYYLHLPVPEELQDKSASELEARHEAVKVGVQGIPKVDEQGQPLKKLAFDNAGKPVLGSNGKQLEVQQFDQQPVYETKFIICLKN